MTYLVTARKWRPMVFEDIVGQGHVATTLHNAIASNRLSHAYIFSGPRGVGKTTTARILARAINCLHPKDSNPDNECELCREITEGRSVNVFEIDGASNRGVDEIRNLREAVRYAPARGKYKVYIIDEVHMLTKEAFNALLKTLEEPPASVIFIFATTEIHKVPATILSRCQRFDFRQIAVDEIVARLRFIAREEHVTIDDDALFLIAKRGDGSMRDAQSLFDQVVSYCGQTIDAAEILSMLNIVDQEMYFRVTGLIRQKDVKGAMLLVDEVITGGFEIREFINGLTEHLRNMLVVLSTGSATLIEASDLNRKRYLEESRQFSETDLLRLLNIAAEMESAIRWGQQPRLKLEVGLVRMVKIGESVEIGRLLQQLEELKKKLDAGGGNHASRLSPLPAETPIRGSVKASQPTLRPDQIVPTMIPTADPFRFSPGLGEHAAAAAARTEDVGLLDDTVLQPTGREALGKWSMLIDEARKQRIAVGTMLSETRLLEMQGNRIQIGCPDDFHLDGLKRHRQFLSELAQRIYGARVQFDAILAEAPSADHGNGASGKGSESAPAGSKEPAHPVLEALVRQFGAKEIE